MHFSAEGGLAIACRLSVRQSLRLSVCPSVTLVICRGVASSKNVGWTHTYGERVEREPIRGVWGQSPQRGPGAEPLVRGSGGEAPLKLKTFYPLDAQWKQQICLILRILQNL